MLKQLRANWNIYFSMAIGNLGIANTMLFKDGAVDNSLIMFAIVGILIGIGDISNKLKDTYGTN